MAVFFAVTLGALAGPRLAGEAARLPALATLERIQTGQAVSDPELAVAAEALAESVDLVQTDAHPLSDVVRALLRRAERAGLVQTDGRVLTDLGLVLLLQAEREGLDEPVGAEKLRDGIAALERGLARSPASSFGWARLAAARLIVREGRPDAAVLGALSMSYATGPYVDKIMAFRVALAFELWDHLDAALKRSAARDLSYLWTRTWDDQKHLINLVCRYDRAFALSQALRQTGTDLAEFDRHYPAYMSPEGCAAKPF